MICGADTTEGCNTESSVVGPLIAASSGRLDPKIYQSYGFAQRMRGVVQMTNIHSLVRGMVQSLSSPETTLVR